MFKHEIWKSAGNIFGTVYTTHNPFVFFVFNGEQFRRDRLKFYNVVEIVFEGSKKN